MKSLTVAYDGRCELCRRCRDWLSRQPAYVPLVFVPLQSPLLEQRFPGLSAHQPEREILVIGDDGSLFRGGAAWLVCLWATRTYREMSLRLASPALFPFVRTFCEVLSAHRLTLSALLRARNDGEMVGMMRAHQPDCTSDCVPGPFGATTSPSSRSV